MHDHEAQPDTSPRHLPTEQHNARLGLMFFAVYLLGYGSYMLVSAFAPNVMGRVIGGLTVAVWWGFALILGAFVLALAYVLLCRTVPKVQQQEEQA